MTRSPSPSASIDWHPADPVDMALNDVPAHRVAGAQGGLEVDRRAAGELAERRAGEGFGNGMEDQPVCLDGLGREADAVDRDRAADVDERGGARCLDREPDALRRHP